MQSKVGDPGPARGDPGRHAGLGQRDVGDAQVIAARAQVTKAKADLARARELVAKQIISLAQLDAAQASFDAASATLTATERQVKAATSGIATAEAGVRLAQARLAAARAARDKFAKCRGNNFTHNAAPTRMHRGHHARGNIRDKNGNAIGNANGQHVARIARKNGVALHKWRIGGSFLAGDPIAIQRNHALGRRAQVVDHTFQPQLKSARPGWSSSLQHIEMFLYRCSEARIYIYTYMYIYIYMYI